jgi:DNA-binding MarR family transcriptional regulator
MTVNEQAHNTREQVATRNAGSVPTGPPHKRDIPRAAPRTTDPNQSPPFTVCREESREMYRLFVDAMLADVVLTRVDHPAALPTISPKLIPALLYLAQHGEQSMTLGQLAEGIGVSLGWASRFTDKLASAGLLDRIRDFHDRRIVRLQLTSQATVICNQLWSDREHAITAALSEIAPDDRPVITRFLRRLVTDLELQTSKAAPHHS